MTEHPNATRVRDLAAAFQRGDLAAVVDAYAEGGVYRVPGENSISGNYDKSQLAQFFIGLAEMTGGTFRIEVEDILGNDTHAVMFWRGSMSRGDQHLDADGGMAFRFDDDGKIAESWFLYSDQRAYDSFYA
ncbi:MAG: nuclear transport factor 2 family protein [Marmoricola sp.]